LSEPRTAISILIGTYGDPDVWGLRAPLPERAVESARNQTVRPTDILRYHGRTLAQARNMLASAATGEWLVFLDGDDELDEHYLEAMAAAVQKHGAGPWLCQPATLGVNPDGSEDETANVIPPRAPGPRPLAAGNHLVIGTMIRADQFRRIGGFHDWPVAEDWDLFLRAWIDGAEVLVVADAIYRVHRRPQSRNTGDVNAVYAAIRKKHHDAAVGRVHRSP
jgi:GT2 family glycosyltransferase